MVLQVLNNAEDKIWQRNWTVHVHNYSLLKNMLYIQVSSSFYFLHRVLQLWKWNSHNYWLAVQTFLCQYGKELPWSVMLIIKYYNSWNVSIYLHIHIHISTYPYPHIHNVGTWCRTTWRWDDQIAFQRVFIMYYKIPIVYYRYIYIYIYIYHGNYIVQWNHSNFNLICINGIVENIANDHSCFNIVRKKYAYNINIYITYIPQFHVYFK